MPLMRWSSMVDVKQLVMIKGTKEGLVLQIDDSCSFDQAIDELSLKLKEGEPHQDNTNVHVIVQLGYRYLKDDQEKVMRHLLEEQYKFSIQDFQSKVMSKHDVQVWQEENEVKAISRTVRSGQTLSVKGDLLLIGTVNPGGVVKATGNIYIMGDLYGIAHAGSDGDERAIIVATFMKPSQLRIAHYISRAPDYETDGVYQECGYVDAEQEQIVIDVLRKIPKLRKELTVFERRIIDG